MPSFAPPSLEKLRTCDSRLIELFIEVVKHFDCTVIFGYRSPEKQYELFCKGRKLIGGVWQITDKDLVVTYRDGITKKSKHNSYPSKAIDAIPYPINWDDRDKHIEFGGFVLGVASQKGFRLIWGGHWKQPFDPGHFQIR